MSEMIIKGEPGCIYLCKLPQISMKSVISADGIAWRNRGNNKINDSVTAVYYVAIPDISKMSDEEMMQLLGTDNRCALGLKRMDLKQVTYRKKITYNTMSTLCTIEYSGNSDEAQWVLAQHDSQQEVPEPLKECHPQSRVMPNLSASVIEDEKKIIKQSFKKAKFEKALPFMEFNPLVEFQNHEQIENLLKTDPLCMPGYVFDVAEHQITHPKPGEGYLLDFSKIKDWTGAYHIDGHSWKMVNDKKWQGFSYVSQTFAYRKNSKTCSEFKKVTHYNHLTKMMFVQYFGSENIAEEPIFHGNVIRPECQFFPTSKQVKVQFIL